MRPKLPSNFHPVDHPLVLEKLSHMRKEVEKVHSREFVRLMRETGMLMGCEATRGLRIKKRNIKGDRGVIECRVLDEQKPVIVPILRSGQILASGIQELIATTYTGHIGLHHDRDTGVIDYLIALPEENGDRKFILVDPIISTGETACRAIEILEDYGVLPERIIFVSLLIGDAGLKNIATNHPDVTVYAVEFGEKVDENGDLIRGLGHISDRQFRTI